MDASTKSVAILAINCLKIVGVLVPAMITIALTTFLNTGSAQTRDDGPSHIPAEGKNNKVFPTVERPQAGWPEISFESASKVCGPNQYQGILRVSLINDRATFDEAVEENQAWYRRFGIHSNRQAQLPVILPSLETGRYDIVSDIAVTLHVNPPANAETRRILEADPDAEPTWAAFVAKYRASSTIIENASVCVPHDLMPSTK